MSSQIAHTTAQYIKKGNVILCPTDTIWGLSADATNLDAIEKVFTIKKRPKDKSFILLVSDIEMLKSYIEIIPKEVVAILEKSQKPTTIIYPKAKNLSQEIIAKDGSIAIRIVMDDFCKELIKKIGNPIISTSANISGEAPAQNYNEISDEIKEKVDYIVPSSVQKNINNAASTILKITNKGLQTLRP